MHALSGGGPSRQPHALGRAGAGGAERFRLVPGASPYGGGRGPTWGRQCLGGREQGPMTADMLRHVCRHGRTSAVRRLFYRIQSLLYIFGCIGEGQSDRAEEGHGHDISDPMAGL